MIIKAATRNNATQLGHYLLNKTRNEHVEVHKVDGFVAGDVLGAMREIDAIAKGVKSQKYLYSLSLSPPKRETVSTDVYDDAIRRVMETTGLSGQPYIAVFHENESRRHLHLVISRIDQNTMTVKTLSHDHAKLKRLSKELFLEQGFDLPKGFVNKAERDPANFSLSDWQQAKRTGLDPRDWNLMAAEAWSLGKDKASFAKELEKRGLYLARGDQRGHVAVSYDGTVRALARVLNKKTKEVRERLGEPSDLRSVEETHQYIRETVAPMLQGHLDMARQERMREMSVLDSERLAMTNKHRLERARMEAGLQVREQAEKTERAGRMRHGLAGLWDWLSGKAKEVAAQNQRETYDAAHRDRTYRQSIIDAQLAERRVLQEKIVETRERHFAKQIDIHRDLSSVFQQEPDKSGKAASKGSDGLSPEFNASSQQARLDWLRQRQQVLKEPQPSQQSEDRLQWLKDNQRREPPKPDRSQPPKERGRGGDQGPGMEP